MLGLDAFARAALPAVYDSVSAAVLASRLGGAIRCFAERLTRG